MKIEILGVGTGLCPELGNVSLLVWNDIQSSAILLDCGCTVYPLLRKMEILGKRDIISKIDKIFISHGHSDHIGSLDMLLSYRALILKKKTAVAGMDLRLFFNEICHLDYASLIEMSEIAELNLVKTDHVPWMPSYGCLLSDKLFYSGDSGKSLLLSKEAVRAEVIIHEVALQTIYGEKEAEPFAIHVGIDDLCSHSIPETRAKTWLAHYAPQEAEELENKALEYGFAGLLKPGQFLTLD